MSDEKLRAAQRVVEFLKDEAVTGAFSRMERRFYEEFIAAESSEERVRAWAKAKTLRDFEQELRSVTEPEEIRMVQAAKAEAERQRASRQH